MKPKFNSYQIKKGETLASVAKKFGLTIQEAKNFHNVHSPDHEIIIEDFPPDLKNLYVYPYIYSKSDDKNEFVKFNYGFTLGNKPSTAVRIYNIMYSIEDKSKNIQTIKIQRSVQFIGNDEENTHFEIDKIGLVFINDEEASELADELAVKASSAIYPLGCIVDRSGNLVTISNFEEIQAKWKTVRKNIEEEYEGKWIEDYLNACEENLENVQNLQLSLANDFFINSFFAGLYVDYTPNFEFEKPLYFPILANKLPLKFRIRQKVSTFLDEYNSVRIQQEGFLDEERSKSDIENNLNFPYHKLLDANDAMAKGFFKGDYFLDGFDNHITSFRINCSIDVTDAKKIEIVASLQES